MDLHSETPSQIKEPLIGFAVGALVGGLVTYFATKKRFEAKANKEIKEVRDYYTEEFIKDYNHSSDKMAEPKKIEPNNTQEVKKGKSLIALKVDPFSLDKAFETSANVVEDIRIIRLQDFTDDDEYDKETLIYYEDDVLTDQYDHVELIDDVIGRECLEHFGEEPADIYSDEFVKGEEDIVYVRNERFKTDYEVIYEHRAAPPSALLEGDEDDD